MNRDERKYFGAKTDTNGSRTRGATWALSLKFKDKLENVKLERGGGDLLLEKEKKNNNKNVRGSKEGDKEIKHSNLLSPILEVSPVGIRRAKSKILYTRRGLLVGTKNTGFHQGFKRGVWEIKGFGFRKCP